MRLYRFPALFITAQLLCKDFMQLGSGPCGDGIVFLRRFSIHKFDCQTTKSIDYDTMEINCSNKKIKMLNKIWWIFLGFHVW